MPDSSLKDDLAVFKACSDETRLRILFLLTEGELCVCEIVAVLDMPQGKISRHLSVLKNAGLVADRREGTWIHYSLSLPDTELRREIAAYLVKQQGHLAESAEDRDRLHSLALDGLVCAPRPVGAREAGD